MTARLVLDDIQVVMEDLAVLRAYGGSLWWVYENRNASREPVGRSLSMALSLEIPTNLLSNG